MNIIPSASSVGTKCNGLCGLLDYQPQKVVLCEKYEYYVKICDYRDASPLSRGNTSHYSTDRTMKHAQ